TNSMGYVSKMELVETTICLAKGTKVQLANGKTKNIEDITYNDDLLVWNFDDGKFDSAKALWIKIPQISPEYNLLKFSDGTELKTINQHRIFNKEQGKFTYQPDETPIGTTTFNASGQEITLVSKEVISENVEYYNIITDRHINCFTNTILTSCRLNNIYPIEDMKFIKDNRKIRLITEFPTVEERYYSGLRLGEQFEETSTTGNVENMSLVKYVDRLKKYKKDDV
ncbi:MAG: Hint domain-containing protein, partial [Clostridia bacterium]